MELSSNILPAGEYPLCCAVKIPQKPYNKSFINQACSVKMAGHWPHSIFASPALDLTLGQ